MHSMGLYSMQKYHVVVPFVNFLSVYVTRHETEMRKLKDIHAAAEKLRREKWIDEKTKKIKVCFPTSLL